MWEQFEHGTYSLFYLDNDDIPELYVVGLNEAEGVRICTIGPDQSVVECRLNRCYGSQYIDRSGMLCNFNGNMGHADLELYTLTDGSFEKVRNAYGSVDFESSDSIEEGSFSWMGTPVSRDEFCANWNSFMDQDSLLEPWEVCYKTAEILNLLSP